MGASIPAGEAWSPGNRCVPMPKLGPLVLRRAAEHPLRTRLIAGAVAAGCLALLVLARTLTPADAGVGTHVQLNMPACGVFMMTGFPCPTCGMTTAFAHVVRGELWSAFFAQPAGMLLALATMGAGIGAIYVGLTGRIWTINWFRVSPALLAGVAFAVLFGGWGFKLTTTAWAMK